MTLVHCNTATDGPLGSQQEQSRGDGEQGYLHELDRTRDAHLAAITQAHQTSLFSGRNNTPGRLRVITQALFSAAYAHGHNTHRDRCDL